MTRRRNGEGSIYPVKDSHGRVTGYRGYVWCAKPGGERYRKYVKGQTYEGTQRAWFKLRDEASRGPVSSDVPKLGDFLSYWLKEIVQPNLAPKTYQTYELFVRLHIVPHLGHKRIDQLQVKDIRQWINKLTSICQCCVQGKDAARPLPKRRCCAIGECCREMYRRQGRPKLGVPYGHQGGLEVACVSALAMCPCGSMSPARQLSRRGTRRWSARSWWPSTAAPAWTT